MYDCIDACTASYVYKLCYYVAILMIDVLALYHDYSVLALSYAPHLH